MSKLLEMKNITKEFPGTKAVDDVSFFLDAGEIVAVMGENGAGKSTLMKILAGIHNPDSGKIFLNGIETQFKNPISAQEHGIAIVHQELSIFPNLSVAENILANRQPVKFGIVKKEEMYKAADQILKTLGVDFDVKAEAGKLSVSQQQVVEIAKAIFLKPKILIMDEPTSALSDKEVDILFKMLKELKAKGIGIVYISHKIPEILTITDRIMALRDGKNSGELLTKDADENKIVRLMVGRDVRFVFPEKVLIAMLYKPENRISRQNK